MFLAKYRSRLEEDTATAYCKIIINIQLVLCLSTASLGESNLQIALITQKQ